MKDIGSMPLISIIVPVFKTEKHIDRCVQSIINQTYESWELILVDDGSPDSSGRLCDEWGKKEARIRVYHKENGGVSSARNLGLDKAKGDYITFVDSDDWIGKDCLKYCVNILSDTNIELFLFGCCRVNSNGESQLWFKNRTTGVCSLEKYIAANNGLLQFNVWGVFFKRNIIYDSNIRFLEGMSNAEDKMFLFSVMEKATQICSTEEVYYYYYDNDTSVTKRINIQVVLKNERILFDFFRGREKLSSVFGYILVHTLSSHCSFSADCHYRNVLKELWNNNKDYIDIKYSSYWDKLSRVFLYFSPMGFPVTWFFTSLTNEAYRIFRRG